MYHSIQEQMMTLCNKKTTLLTLTPHLALVSCSCSAEIEPTDFWVVLDGRREVLLCL